MRQKFHLFSTTPRPSRNVAAPQPPGRAGETFFPLAGPGASPNEAAQQSVDGSADKSADASADAGDLSETARGRLQAALRSVRLRLYRPPPKKKRTVCLFARARQ